MAELDTPRVLTLLNRILEQELAGVIRYTHYSLLVYGYNRIPYGQKTETAQTGVLWRPQVPFMFSSWPVDSKSLHQAPKWLNKSSSPRKPAKRKTSAPRWVLAMVRSFQPKVI